MCSHSITAVYCLLSHVTKRYQYVVVLSSSPDSSTFLDIKFKNRFNIHFIMRKVTIFPSILVNKTSCPKIESSVQNYNFRHKHNIRLIFVLILKRSLYLRPEWNTKPLQKLKLVTRRLNTQLEISGWQWEISSFRDDGDVCTAYRFQGCKRHAAAISIRHMLDVVRVQSGLRTRFSFFRAVGGLESRLVGCQNKKVNKK